MAEPNTIQNRPKRIPKRTSTAIMNSLSAGVVPRIGLEHINVGRKTEIEALMEDLANVGEGGATFGDALAPAARARQPPDDHDARRAAVRADAHGGAAAAALLPDGGGPGAGRCQPDGGARQRAVDPGGRGAVVA